MGQTSLYFQSSRKTFDVITRPDVLLQHSITRNGDKAFLIVSNAFFQHNFMKEKENKNVFKWSIKVAKCQSYFSLRVSFTEYSVVSNTFVISNKVEIGTTVIFILLRRIR